MYRIALLISGAASVMFQATVLRLFLGIFEGNELVITIFMSFWLLWPAVGSVLFVKIFRPSLRKVVYTFIFSGLSIFISILTLVFTRKIWGLWIGEEMGIFPMFLWIFLLLLPFGILHGFLFYIFIGIIRQREKASEVYLWDSAGDLVGGALFGYILINIFSSFETGYFIIVILFLGSLIFLKNLRKKERNFLIFFLFLALISILLWGKKLERLVYKKAWSPEKIVEFFSTKYADYVITESNEEYAVFTNNELSFYYPDPMKAEILVHPVMLQREKIHNVLVIEGGIEVLKEIKKYTPLTIDYIMVDKKFIQKIKKYLSQEDRTLLNSISIYFGDARKILKCQDKKYSFIFLFSSEPKNLSASRYFTVEFFKLCKEHLEENGVIAFYVTGGENYISQEKAEYLRSINSTLKKVFKNVLALPGEKTLFMASNFVLHQNAEVLINRLSKKNILTVSLSPGVLQTLYFSERIEWVKKCLQNEGRINSDFSPISSYFYITLFGKKHSRLIVDLFRKIAKVNFYVFIVPLIGVIVILGIFLKRNATMFTSAFVGTSLELVTILGFETIHGYVYHLYGIVVASFMLGIVVGTWCVRKFKKTLDKFSCVYLSILPWIVILSFYLIKNISLEIAFQFIFPVLNLLSGIPVGLTYASLTFRKEEQEKKGSLLYALDMLGGMVGIFVVGLFLIPLFGIFNTAIFLSLVSLFSLVNLSYGVF